MRPRIRSMLIVISAAMICALPIHAQDSSDNAPSQKDSRAEDSSASGTWVWEQQFSGRSMERSVTLVVKGSKITGIFGRPQPPQAESNDEDRDDEGRNVGRRDAGRRGLGRRGGGGFNDPIAITNGKLDGDKISFDVTRKFGENDFTTVYAGVISGDEIAGMSSFSFGGRVRESAWMAKRDLENPVDLTQLEESAVKPVNATETTVASTTEEVDSSNTQTETTSSDDQASKVSLAEFYKIPEPMRVPDAGEETNEPYQPRAILPGGIVMPLYPPNSPHLNSDRIQEPETYSLSGTVHGRINSIVNIHNPSIEVHFASPSMNTGSVVILCAGGGHRTLNVGTESADFVPFFYNYGVNTVILRNRLRSDGYEPTEDAVRDAMQAIRLVRKNADAWKFDPKRIGIMGFSAGAELSAPAAIQFEEFDKENSEADDPLAGITSRPDFVGIIYPGPTPFTRDPELDFPLNTPPAFITCAGAGDRIHAIWALDYFSAMLKKSIPNVEMHIYGNGYHPGTRGATGGLTHRGGIPFGSWQNRFIEWFDDLGFLSEPGSATKAAQDIEQFVSNPPRRRGEGRGRGRQRDRAQPSGN